MYTQHSRGFYDGAEIFQFFSHYTSRNDIQTAYQQQQPPLDYYFSSFSNQLWGQNKFAVRFHAMLFYLILSLILPLILWCFCSSNWAVIFGVFFFSVNHVIRLHSVNGRPLSLALLTGSLFLFFYMSYCRTNQSKQNNLFFPVLASQYLFVMSIGLQPVIFIGSLFISSFWLLLTKEKLVFKNLFLSHIIVAFLALPIYIKMHFFAQNAYKFKPFSFEKIISYIESYNVLDLFKKYFYPFYEQLTPSFFLLILGLVTVVFTRKRISDLTVQIGLALLIFILFFDFLFGIAINWHLNHRYFIVWSLFFVFFSVLALNEVFQSLKERSWKVYLFLVPVGFLFLWNSYFQILTIKQESRFWPPYEDNDLEEVYHYLKMKGNTEDLIIELSLTQPPVHRTENLLQMNYLFYDPNHHPRLVSHYLHMIKTPPFFHEATGTYISYVNWKEVPSKRNQRIFFVAVNNRYEDKAYSILLDSIEKEYRIGKFSIFEWTLKTKNLEQEYKKFLIHLIQKTPPKYKAALYETLLYYACKNKDKFQSIKLLKEYKALEPFLDEFTTSMNLPSRFALRRRAKYFKNESYCHAEMKN